MNYAILIKNVNREQETVFPTLLEFDRKVRLNPILPSSLRHLFYLCSLLHKMSLRVTNANSAPILLTKITCCDV